MNKVMIDFETLDTTCMSVAFSVGLSFFDEDKVIHSMYINLKMQQQIEQGRTVSADTIAFWMAQPEHIYKLLIDDPMDLSKGLQLICKKMKEFDVQELWANGAAFDIPILDTLMGKKDTPWSHRSYRCFRTLKKLFTEDEVMHLTGHLLNPHAHHPMYDAQYQARCTILFLRYLNQLREA